MGRASTRGRDSTRQVMLTICRSLVPVREATLRGLARTSYVMAVSNHGRRRCVPSG